MSSLYKMYTINPSCKSLYVNLIVLSLNLNTFSPVLNVYLIIVLGTTNKYLKLFFPLGYALLIVLF